MYTLYILPMTYIPVSGVMDERQRAVLTLYRRTLTLNGKSLKIMIVSAQRDIICLRGYLSSSDARQRLL